MKISYTTNGEEEFFESTLIATLEPSDFPHRSLIDGTAVNGNQEDFLQGREAWGERLPEGYEGSSMNPFLAEMFMVYLNHGQMPYAPKLSPYKFYNGDGHDPWWTDEHIQVAALVNLTQADTTMNVTDIVGSLMSEGNMSEIGTENYTYRILTFMCAQYGPVTYLAEELFYSSTEVLYAHALNARDDEDAIVPSLKELLKTTTLLQKIPREAFEQSYSMSLHSMKIAAAMSRHLSMLEADKVVEALKDGDFGAQVKPELFMMFMNDSDWVLSDAVQIAKIPASILKSTYGAKYFAS